MGEGDEADFGLYFFAASKGESSKSPVLFGVPVYRFYLPAFFFFYSFFACRRLFYLLATAIEVFASLDNAVVCRLGGRPNGLTKKRRHTEMVPNRKG